MKSHELIVKFVYEEQKVVEKKNERNEYTKLL